LWWRLRLFDLLDLRTHVAGEPFAELLGALARLRDELAGAVGNVRRSADSVSAAAAEIGRETSSLCPPHELLGALRALRRVGLVRLDKVGPGRFRLGAEEGLVELGRRLEETRITAVALVDHVDEMLAQRTRHDYNLRVEFRCPQPIDIDDDFPCRFSVGKLGQGRASEDTPGVFLVPPEVVQPVTFLRDLGQAGRGVQHRSRFGIEFVEQGPGRQAFCGRRVFSADPVQRLGIIDTFEPQVRVVFSRGHANSRQARYQYQGFEIHRCYPL